MFSTLRALFVPNRSTPEPRVTGAVLPGRDLAGQVGDGPLGLLERRRTTTFDGYSRADLYRYLRDHIPVVSAGVWTWVHLCATPQRMTLRGPDAEAARADRLLAALSRRVYPRADGDGRGFERLVESVLLDLFTTGRVALEAKLLPDRSGISHVIAHDASRIVWHTDAQGRQHPWLEGEDAHSRRLLPDTLFFRTLQNDLHQPHGIEPLASIPFVVEIEQRMLNDMARASHNAGTPRLQVRMAPPDRNPGEDHETYTKRINTYFSDTMTQFKHLEPDDNVFTWSDVEVELIGGSGSEGSVWKINREQVIEDVITGLKLFPWALGRSHGTTKNWIYAQYNLLMQIVDSVQLLGSDLVEWLARLELRLRGNLADPRWVFAPNQDPFLLDRNRARLLELERVERLVKGGFISKAQAARELGYGEPVSADSTREPRQHDLRFADPT